MVRSGASDASSTGGAEQGGRRKTHVFKGEGEALSLRVYGKKGGRGGRRFVHTSTHALWGRFSALAFAYCCSIPFI